MLKIAIPNKGRLREKTIRLLQDAGLKFDADERKLYTLCENFDIKIYFARAYDIPLLVSQRSVDVGISATDLMQERGVVLQILQELDYGASTLVLAGPNGTKLEGVSWGKQLRIATSYPNITSEYLSMREYEAEVYRMNGAVEMAPSIGVAELIVDVSSSGKTLIEHDLVVLDVVMESKVCLFGWREFSKSPETLQSVVEAIAAVLLARQKKLLKANVPVKALKSITDLLPGITGPDIIDILGHPDMRKIEVVVDEEDVLSIIPRLKAMGAIGILILNIEKIIP